MCIRYNAWSISIIILLAIGSSSWFNYHWKWTISSSFTFKYGWTSYVLIEYSHSFVFIIITFSFLKCDQSNTSFCLFKTVLEQSLLFETCTITSFFFFIPLFLLCLSRTYTDKYSSYTYEKKKSFLLFISSMHTVCFSCYKERFDNDSGLFFYIYISRCYLIKESESNWSWSFWNISEALSTCESGWFILFFFTVFYACVFMQN